MFDFLKNKDINKGVEKWENTPGSILLDVRTKEEYAQYHIKGSLNIALDDLDHVKQHIPNKETTIFVHCLSGGRSARAAAYLKSKGYGNVYDIGGISLYKGVRT